MTWTKQPPTEPGWYWVRRRYFDEPVVVHVLPAGCYPGYEHANDYLHAFETCGGNWNVKDPYYSSWWSEPLEPPGKLDDVICDYFVPRFGFGDGDNDFNGT